MRPLLLGVTPNLHEENASKLRGTLNRATLLIASLIVIPSILWLLHAVGTIPSFFPRQLPSEVIATIGGIDGSIDGATGFMIDSVHFLTTERALKGDGGTSSMDDLATVSFLDSTGETSEPAEGSVIWISDSVGGTKLVLLKMDEDRVDFLVPSSESLTDGSRLLIAGRLLDVEDGKPKPSQGSFNLTLFEDTLGSADWGEMDPLPYEGAPVVMKDENDAYSAIGLVSQGSLVIKLPVDALREAGANL